MSIESIKSMVSMVLATANYFGKATRFQPFNPVRVSPGVHEPPRVDPERFLSMIRFDARQKLDDLPDFQLNS